MGIIELCRDNRIASIKLKYELMLSIHFVAFISGGVRICRSKIEELALQAQSEQIFAKGEILPPQHLIRGAFFRPMVARGRTNSLAHKALAFLFA